MHGTRSRDPTSGTQPGTRSPAAAPPDPGTSRFVISLLSGHAQLPRPTASAIKNSRHRFDEAARRQEHEHRRQRGQQGGHEGGAVPPPETVVFDIDEQVEHGVYRQPNAANGAPTPNMLTYTSGNTVGLA